MGYNILITGAAGYIGGSIIAEFISSKTLPIKEATIHAAVRSEEQLRSLSSLGIPVIQLNLDNEKAVMDAVIGYSIDIVINTASCFDPRIVSSIIKALGERRGAIGHETYFIQSSVSAVFAAEGGWPFGVANDSEPLYEKEKQIEGGNPVRATNITVVEQAKLYGVTAFNILLPNIYGRGRGEVRKLSVSIPAFVRTSIKYGVVYKFDKDGNPPSTYITDLTALYSLLVEKILLKEPVPNGKDGYYFATAHTVSWWSIMERLAEGLYARGLVAEPKAQTWPSYEMAAEYLGWPLQHLQAMGTSSGKFEPVNAHKLVWQPQWDEKKFMDSLDGEIQDVLELDTVKPNLFDTLINSE